jgi:intein/homing endonuclease
MDNRLANKEWRMSHLYKVRNKKGQTVTFKKNRAQEDFDKRKSNRNIILKSRQLGFTTFEAIDSLDDTLFVTGTDVLMRSYDDVSQKDIFDSKIVFAWNNLPEEIRDLYELEADRANKLKFNWGDNTTSSITVRLHGRGGTYSREHISEFAKICKNSSKDADEVITGDIPAVPMTGRIDIESTAEEAVGDFYNMFWEAWERGEPTMPVHFKAFFYNWQWDDAELNEVIPLQDRDLPKEFIEYKKKHKLTDIEITYYYQRWLQVGKNWSRLKREYPTTCVVGNTIIDSVNGMENIEDIIVDGEKILAKYDQGIKETYEIKTKLGYSLQATDDHRVMLDNGEFEEVKNLLGKRIKLGIPELGKKIQTVEYRPKPFLKTSIEINEEIGRFLGYFMGDGSLFGNKGTITFACDKECPEVVVDISYLLKKYFGEPNYRITGTKQGCMEIRTSSMEFVKPFFELGLLRKNSSGSFKRKICVPECIKKSPKSVIAEFIKGLFESDGFVSRDGLNVKFFTKYERFAQEVQLLLLSFGITCLLNKKIKKAGNGNNYVGYEIVLRKQETIAFKKNLGFVSNKKKDRLLQIKKTQSNELIMKFDDEVISITPTGKKQVWDITTKTHTFIANGIIVHNCEEAFEAAGDKLFDTEALDAMNVREPMEQAGYWEYFADYKPGHRYAVAADPSYGVGKDNATICVIDFDAKDSNGYVKPEMVAMFCSNTVPPDLLAYEIRSASTRYGNCLVAPERNNPGMATLAILKGICNNIYKEVKVSGVEDVETDKLGWSTNKASKPRMISDLRTAISERLINIPCRKTIHELNSYLRDDIDNVGSESVRHFDRVISLAICWQMQKYAGISGGLKIIDDGEFNKFDVI